MATREVDAILFDGDGVVQSAQVNIAEALAALVDADGERFAREIFAAEAPFLEKDGDLRGGIGEVIGRWNVDLAPEDVLAVINRVGPDADVVSLISSVKALGVRCGIASNQQSSRAAYMSEHLGYSALFDWEFYSFDLEARKPEAAFFVAILGRIDVPAGRILFIDDKVVNAEAAEKVGMKGRVFGVEEGAARLREVMLEFGVKIG